MGGVLDLFGVLSSGSDEAPPVRGSKPLAGVVRWCDGGPDVNAATTDGDGPAQEWASMPLAGVSVVLVKGADRPVADPDASTFDARYAQFAGLGGPAAVTAQDGTFTFPSVALDGGPYWLGVAGHTCFPLRYARQPILQAAKPKDKPTATTVWRRCIRLDRPRFLWRLRWNDDRWQVQDDLTGNGEWVDLSDGLSPGFVLHCLKVLPYDKVRSAVGRYPDPDDPGYARQLYGLYRSGDGTNRLEVKPEQPESRRVPPFIELPAPPIGTSDAMLLGRTWLSRNVSLASFAAWKPGKTPTLTVRYVPVVKPSLLAKLTTTLDLLPGLSVTRGFSPPSACAIGDTG